MGQMEFRADMYVRPDNALWTGFAEGATDDQVQQALAIAREKLTAAQNAQHLVVLQAIRALSAREMSTRDIARATGISKSAVGRYLGLGVDGVAVENRPDVTAIVRTAWGREGEE